MKERTYHVPPKLHSQLLLSGLTISEIGIALILTLAGFFSASLVHWEKCQN